MSKRALDPAEKLAELNTLAEQVAEQAALVRRLVTAHEYINGSEYCVWCEAPRRDEGRCEIDRGRLVKTLREELSAARKRAVASVVTRLRAREDPAHYFGDWGKGRVCVWCDWRGDGTDPGCMGMTDRASLLVGLRHQVNTPPCHGGHCSGKAEYCSRHAVELCPGPHVDDDVRGVLEELDLVVLLKKIRDVAAERGREATPRWRRYENFCVELWDEVVHNVRDALVDPPAHGDHYHMHGHQAATMTCERCRLSWQDEGVFAFQRVRIAYDEHVCGHPEDPKNGPLSRKLLSREKNDDEART